MGLVNLGCAIEVGDALGNLDELEIGTCGKVIAFGGMVQQLFCGRGK